MGYSRRTSTLDAIAGFLTPATTGAVTHFEHPEPTSLAYKIREAFYLTTIYPDRYPALTELAKAARVQVQSAKNLVIVYPNTRKLSALKSRVLTDTQRITSGTNETIVTHIEAPAELPSRDLPEPKHPDRVLIIEEALSRFQIIDRWEKAQKSPATVGRKMSVGRAHLSDLDIDKLAAWAATVNLLVIPGEDTITILQHDPLLSEIAWGSSH